MFRDFWRAFADLFTHRGSRAEVSGLLALLAVLPISELVVTRMFAHLILDGEQRYAEDPNGVVQSAVVFFVAFAVSRALHHVVRLNRVRVFRRGFEKSGEERPAAKEAWSWAAAFELSAALVALIQVFAFCAVFVWIDLRFGLLNVLIGGLVLAIIAWIYRRQLAHQIRYLTEGAPTAENGTAVSDRVGRRVRDAEVGAAVASLAMAASLGLVLWRVIEGGVSGADAIVLFLGLRLMYSQVGNLSASAMRFARAKARLEAGPGAATDDEDEFDDLDDPDARELQEAELEEARPSPHRSELVSQMVLAGQRGEMDHVRRLGNRLSAGVIPMPNELKAQQAAEGFAALAEPVEGVEPVTAMWWSRPFPGAVGNWLNPLLLRRLADRPVLFRSPVAPERGVPHLMLGGSILASAHEDSVVVGAGALNAGVTLDPQARYVSVRGPLSAALVREADGHVGDEVGDPVVLAARHLPLERGATNGRLAFARHVSHAKTKIVVPDDLHEVDLLVSRPEDVEALVHELLDHDGVVTSDPSVVAICHSYGVPVAPVTFEGADALDFVVRDYLLGLDLPEEAGATTVPLDLGSVTWDDLLAVHAVDADRLDALEAHVRRGVELHLEQVQAQRAQQEADAAADAAT